MTDTLIRTEELSLIWLLFRLTAIIARIRQRELRKLGISSPEAAVITSVKESHSAVTAADLVRWLVKKPNTVSSLLDRMEKRGLVKRCHDLERKNYARVILTEKGEQLYVQLSQREWISHILSEFPDSQYSQLQSLLELFHDKAVDEHNRSSDIEISYYEAATSVGRRYSKEAKPHKSLPISEVDWCR